MLKPPKSGAGRVLQQVLEGTGKAYIYRLKETRILFPFLPDSKASGNREEE
jgi:hypothetical protein